MVQIVGKTVRAGYLRRCSSIGEEQLVVAASFGCQVRAPDRMRTGGGCSQA